MDELHKQNAALCKLSSNYNIWALIISFSSLSVTDKLALQKVVPLQNIPSHLRLQSKLTTAKETTIGMCRVKMLF